MPDSLRALQELIARHRCEEAAALVRAASSLLDDVKSVAGLNGGDTQVSGCIQELDTLAERVAGAATPKGPRKGVAERGVQLEAVDGAKEAQAS